VIPRRARPGRDREVIESVGIGRFGGGRHEQFDGDAGLALGGEFLFEPL